jgi:colanic acid/amylovoran biosynthesis protein
MRLLVESGAYDVRNLGDVAMLKVCVRRLRTLWPEARIDVVTADPARLAAAVPDATPLPRHPLGWWPDKPVFHVASLPRCLRGPTHATDRVLRRLAPVLAWRATRLRDRLAGACRRHAAGIASFEGALEAADAVVACGGGYLADDFAGHAVHVLGVLARARALGKPAAMFGQGLGPALHPVLRHRLRAGLRGLAVLALREGVRGPALIQELGVRVPETMVTGDDALELACGGEPVSTPEAIGFNLRLASFANIEPAHARLVRDGVVQAARALGLPILPLPISCFDTVNDSRAARELLGDTGLLEAGWEGQLTVEEVIRNAGRCGVVVTASYHSAVFALAQGAPVIGLTRSAYYADKFNGLAALFPSGVEVLALDELGSANDLASATVRLWGKREALRPALVAAAIQQRDTGRRAYARFEELVQSGRRPRV